MGSALDMLDSVFGGSTTGSNRQKLTFDGDYFATVMTIVNIATDKLKQQTKITVELVKEFLNSEFDLVNVDDYFLMCLTRLVGISLSAVIEYTEVFDADWLDITTSENLKFGTDCPVTVYRKVEKQLIQERLADSYDKQPYSESTLKAVL